MNIDVNRPAADGLSRQRWSFYLAASYGEQATLRLSSYQIERRKLPKGGYKKAQPADRWSTMDERSYYSGLKRPVDIPEDVKREAIDQLVSAIVFKIRDQVI